MTNTPNETQHRPADLADAVHTIDGLSKEGFSEIAAIADLMKSRIESAIANGGGGLESLYHAATAIQAKALLVQSCIESEANTVGCKAASKLTKPTPTQ